jgi:Raf kinase inhibitor-like YbhB/YbcL family protein
MVMTFRLTSPAFDNNAEIPKRHTCSGEELSPPLEWSGAPEGTRSFALVCEDPDAPGGTFHHWAVFDIPADWTQLPEGLAPAETQVSGLRQAMNDFGKSGYGGPCPPKGHGIHHYHFRLLALGVDRLDLTGRASCPKVAERARAHLVGSAELVGLFQR